MAVVRVKSTHPESQGPCVLIDDFMYDPKVHTLFEPTDAELAAIAALAPPGVEVPVEEPVEPLAMRLARGKKK